MIYKCTKCRSFFGSHPEIPNLTPMPELTGRWLDCSEWKCPHCGVRHNDRDLQPFLGLGGYRSLAEATESEIERLIEVNRGRSHCLDKEYDLLQYDFRRGYRPNDVYYERVDW